MAFDSAVLYFYLALILWALLFRRPDAEALEDVADIGAKAEPAVPPANLSRRPTVMITAP